MNIIISVIIVVAGETDSTMRFMFDCSIFGFLWNADGTIRAVFVFVYVVLFSLILYVENAIGNVFVNEAREGSFLSH